MEEDKPLILVTNDDGIFSAGIKKLVESMSNLGNVVVIAPDKQQSAVSSALTIHKPLRAAKAKLPGAMEAYAVDGTPTDCVKLGLCFILNKKPDLVVSGINHGKNTSINVLYSGTVSGAIEGTIAGIPSIAFSMGTHNPDADLTEAAKYCEKIAEKLLDGKYGAMLLNVNFPSDNSYKGIKVTKLANSYWYDTFEKRLDPHGKEYYWFAGEYTTFDSDPDFDDVALEHGYVSLTPLKFDFTDYSKLDELKIFEGLN